MTKAFIIRYLIISSVLLILQPLVMTQEFLDSFCLILATITGHIVGIFDPTLVMDGPIMLVLNGEGVWVTEACLAIHHSLLLVAAVLAFPNKVSVKILGVVLALASVQLMNIARLISLYIIQKVKPDLFDFVHEEVWPFVITFSVIALFCFWIAVISSKLLTSSAKDTTANA